MKKIGLISTMPPSNENNRIGEEIKALGHKFHHIDMRTIDISIKDGIVNEGKLSELDLDIVIVRGVLSSIKPISAIVKDLRKKGVLVFDNNFLEHEYSINKVTDLIKLANASIKVPDTYHTKEFDNYSKAARMLGYPVIVKSTRSGKGVSVYKVDSDTQMKSLIDSLVKREKMAKNFILQEFIPYAFDIRALIIGKSVFAMQRIPKKGEFRANFSLGGSVKTFNLKESDKKLAIKALNSINMTIGGVDLLITKSGETYVLEVNHNAGFTGMEKATGVNIGKVFVKHALGNAK